MRRGTPLPPPPSSPLLQEDESLDQEDTLTPDDDDDDDEMMEGLVLPPHQQQYQHDDDDDDDEDKDTSPIQSIPQDHDAAPQLQDEDEEHEEEVLEHHGAYIVRNIASFLTLSDVASIASLGESDWTPGDSWAVGTTWAASVMTPPTPAIVAVSPTVPPPTFDRRRNQHNELVPDLQELERDEEDEEDDDDNYYWEDRLQQRRRKWAQERLAAAVFSHPRPLRSYCLEAYEAARSIRQQQQQQHISSSLPYNPEQEHPETLREAPQHVLRQQQQQPQHRRRNYNKRVNILLIPIDAFFSSTPISVMFDVLDFVIETSKDTTFAAFKISITSIDALISALITLIQKIWNAVTNFNPFELLDAVISIQFNAMGKTSEVLVSGIQSVATGVGSASNFALQRLSRGGSAAHAPQQHALHRSGSPSSAFGGTSSGLRRARTSAGNLLNKKLLRKLSSINSAAEVVAYKEVHDDTGGLSKEAKKRVHRMMHYDVSLRPFVATVVLPVPPRERGMSMFENVDFPTRSTDPSYERQVTVNEDEATSPSSTAGDSPFMCTPQSFPPTPSSRRLVMARGSRYVEDVVFLARDQLRVHDALESANERTRAMANALREGKRLAVFNADDAASGIALTCGQHIATKVGNMLYCSTRSMVPVLRNCFVYFEVTIMPRPVGNMIMQASMATLSIGLSTLEMPLNTLVGAWKGSVGLCTTGQILTAGQWCSPVDPSQSAYGDNATVGCLVCLDDGTAFETWEGLMVTAAVTFSVNGRVVSPPVSSMPMVGSMGIDGGGMGPDGVLLDPFQHARLLPAPPALSSTIPLLVPAEEELYATVSLHSPATSVMCRFSAEDVVATDRVHVGASMGVTVYAVDGSVIFEK